MKEQVIEFIIQFLPALIAGLTCIITMFKVLTGLKEWKDSNDLSSVAQLEKDIKAVVKKNYDLHNAIQKVLAENEELKNQLKDTLLLITTEAEKKADEIVEEIETKEE